jgi:hypothetical protein
MKRNKPIFVVLCLSLAALLWDLEIATAQSGYPHHPLCGGNGHGGSSSCWSYATSRAFGRSWNHSVCPASTFNGVNEISLDHFEQLSFNYNTVKAGDIIGWGSGQPNHVCYVTSVNWPPSASNISVAQVENEGSTTEQTNLKLSDVINGTGGAIARGNPTMLFRKRARWSIKLENSFTGGTVGVGSCASPTEYSSPHPVSNLHWESTVTGVAVMNGREFEGYIRRFRRWTSSYSEHTTVCASLPVRSLSYSTPTDFSAYLPREFNVTFQNSLLGATGGVIKVNQTIYPAPHNTTVIEDDPSIVANAIYNEINRIKYIFAQWNDGSTLNPRTFNVGDHSTYTASYNAKPLHPANIAAGGAVGSNVCVSWQVHPHANVTQYQIWRKVKHKNQGTTSPPVLLTTLPRTTTQFIDYDYVVTDGYTHDLVWYDVRSYFSLNSTYSDENWTAVYADGSIVPDIAPTESVSTVVFAPGEWQLGNSPNPFNPFTRITYSLPEEGSVSLAIYDLQGREVISLFEGHRKAGYYNAMWDGRNGLGYSVGSGMYFARLIVSSGTGDLLHSRTIKLLLTK